MNSDKNTYYKEVSAYYNADAGDFEGRFQVNQTLQKIRQSFRDETPEKNYANILEIGFGPGLDILFFAKKYSTSNIYGIDVSDGMFSCALQNVEKEKLSNTHLAVGSVEDISTLFPSVSFDLIYVYFGALNTVENLSLAAKELQKILNPKGTMVLTFVNKWYMMGILLPLLKAKFNIAFKRLQKVWGGYSNAKFLASKCYTPNDISSAFCDFEIEKKRGYSILFPAWYDNAKTIKLGRVADLLWNIDRFLNKTPFWKFGEYTLFVFKHKL